MALIFQNATAATANKRRYGRKYGSGIFTTFGRRLLQGNVKHLINAVSKSNIAHKAIDAVQHGISNTIKSGTQRGIEEIASTVAYNLKKKQNNKKKKEQK